MTNEQILKKAIEKAEKNGWKFGKIRHECSHGHYSPMDVIFQHNFAKAFWGTAKTGWSANSNEEEWQYHLQQMVLEENPIRYLEKFL